MNTTQTTIDDALAVRDEAIARVDEHADPDWKCEALNALYAAIHQVGIGADLSTDDVDWPGVREPRAHGPIMLAAAREGLIEHTDRVRRSHKTSCHAAPKALWRVVELP